MFLQTQGGLCGNGLTKDTGSWTQMSRIQLPHGARTVNFHLMQGRSSTGNTASLIFAELQSGPAVQDRAQSRGVNTATEVKALSGG